MITIEANAHASNGSGGGEGLKVPKSSLNAAVATSISSAGHGSITARFQLTFHPDHLMKAGHDEGVMMKAGHAAECAQVSPTLAKLFAPASSGSS